MVNVIINSTAGNLEAIYKQPKETEETTHCVLLMHPHPLYGGNMHSKVVFLMEKIFLANNFATLKFNFRGVGNSEGSYGEGKDEILDATTCCDWLKEKLPNAHLWVGGFSFGAYITIQIMMRRVEVQKFIALGAPANMFDMSFIYPCPVNGLFVHGEKDEIAPFKEIDKIIKKAIKTKGKDIQSTLIANSNHYFDDHHEELYKILDSYIKKELNI